MNAFGSTVRESKPRNSYSRINVVHSRPKRNNKEEEDCRCQVDIKSRISVAKQADIKGRNYLTSERDLFQTHCHMNAKRGLLGGEIEDKIDGFKM